MKDILINTQIFGLFLSLIAYTIGLKIKEKFKTPFANPLLIAIVITIAALTAFDIPYEKYNSGGAAISLMLVPATAALGLSVYRQFETLKRNFLPVIAGCFVGGVTSVACSIFFCRLFLLHESITASLIPRAVTSPIAMEIAEALGGIVPVAVAVVIFSGIVGAVFAPVFMKVFKLKIRVALGVAIGVSSSAAGTSKAIEIGEIEGAMSGLAVGITGLITVVVTMFL